MEHISCEENFQDYPFAEKQCITAFISGCDIHCYGCHNPQMQDPYTWNNDEKVFVINKIKSALSNSNTPYLALCGGDPLFDGNIELVAELIRDLKDTNIALYTGYELSVALSKIEKIKSILNTNILPNVKYLKVGYFKMDSYINWPLNNFIVDKFRLATKNQRIYKFPSLEDVTDLSFSTSSLDVRMV